MLNIKNHLSATINYFETVTELKIEADKAWIRLSEYEYEDQHYLSQY
jgi:hypothetical protein